MEIVCTVAHVVSRFPNAFETRLTASGAVVAKREFADHADAAAEAERLRLQFLDCEIV
jgi:hypothetical protein